MLLYTLPSMRSLHADEYYFTLDRCTDRSKRLIEYWIPRERLTLVEEQRDTDWVFRAAWLRREAYKETANDVILNTSADIMLDPKLVNYAPLMRDAGAVVLGFLDHPYNLQCFLRQIYSTLTPLKSYSGLYLFNRRYLKENIEEVKRIDSAEDTHLLMSIKRARGIAYRNTRSIHLRPNETPESNYRRGVNYWRMLRCRAPRALASSLAMMRPEMISGYLHERMNNRYIT